MSHEVVAELVRNGFVEGRHRGSVVALDADGALAWHVGDAAGPVLPRSANKPIQALAMVEMGLDLSPEQLALACASHSGEPFHLEVVRSILDGLGLTEDALQCPVDWPLDDAERDALLRADGGPSRLHMNCSGKHAAMLATCVANEWPTETYLDPDHPLQRGILATFERLTSEPVAHRATDGCGAPLLGTSLVGLARAFRTLATAEAGPERTVAEAIRSHPQHVSGTRRDEAALIRAVPGLITKAGAEANQALGLADGRAIALKIEDGGLRARPVVLAGALLRLGVDPGDAVKSEAPAAGGAVLRSTI